MDEAITCRCGNQQWVIGTSGTRCEKCGLWLLDGEVKADVRNINERIKQEKWKLQPSRS